MSETVADKKQDRRVRRSQKLLFDALMALITEKDYESITVSEIVNRADVARATFYVHFDDKNALLLSSLDTLAETIVEEVKGFSKEDLLSGTLHPALVVFDYLQRNPVLFRVILNGQGGSFVLQRLRFYAAQTAHQVLANLELTPSIPPNIIIDFVAGAMLSVITGWLEDDMRTPQDELARMFYSLVRPGILSALSLNEVTKSGTTGQSRTTRP